MTKGTPSQGRRSGKKSHRACRRCGNRSFHISRAVCASCGFGRSTRKRSYTWATKV